jgi:hypothetical protein
MNDVNVTSKEIADLRRALDLSLTTLHTDSDVCTYRGLEIEVVFTFEVDSQGSWLGFYEFMATDDSGYRAEIEPSLYLSDEELEEFIEALGDRRDGPANEFEPLDERVLEIFKVVLDRYIALER